MKVADKIGIIGIHISIQVMLFAIKFLHQPFVPHHGMLLFLYFNACWFVQTNMGSIQTK